MRFRSKALFQYRGSGRRGFLALTVLRAGLRRAAPFDFAVLPAMLSSPDFYFATVSGYAQRAGAACTPPRGCNTGYDAAKSTTISFASAGE
ncbi:exported hypothetical protein [Candidatus Sulfopaludibacter sp. SbA4]|nr:exported hypothetical protein [Candidatus Sulfopaludibacter sp. SbA4]